MSPIGSDTKLPLGRQWECAPEHTDFILENYQIDHALTLPQNRGLAYTWNESTNFQSMSEGTVYPFVRGRLVIFR